ncbi:glycosyltransferase family 61 protein [Hydrocarboniphaga sp.]|uniref:glycosyltransferase family 61 protein n=1 Tax=Hydrocarboniphaga sp. TaxID=2033016 RepID=UPI002626E97D|nr:glycosyltransferase family 61 protein [Hydrocarboniphaga sp.]
MITNTTDKCLVVHLGMPRTGTGALRRFCLDNRSALRELRWFVDDPSLPASEDTRQIATHIDRALRGSPAKTSAHLDAVSELLSAPPAKNFLIWNAWPTLTEAPRWQALQQATATAGRRLILIGYIREQRSWLLSAYAQRVLHHNMSAAAARFIQKSRSAAALDYLAIYSMLAQAVGSERLVLRPYEPARFPNEDICPDFLAALNLPLDGWQSPGTRINSSPGVIDLELARILNSQADTAALDGELLLKVAAEYGIASDRKLYRLAKASVLDGVAALYQEANRALARLLSPTSTEALFGSGPPQSYEPFRPEELVNAASIELLVRYRDAQQLAAKEALKQPAEPSTTDNTEAPLQLSTQPDPPALIAYATMAKPISLYRAPHMSKGIHQIEDGMACEVLEERGVKRHQHILGSFPSHYPIETEFVTGPVLAIKLLDGLTDSQAGVTLTRQGNPVRESVVIERLIETYSSEREGQTLYGGDDSSDAIVLPLATQRKENYCRWWLDSVSKIFIASRSSLLGEDYARGKVKLLTPIPSSQFHKQTLDLLLPRLNCPWQSIDSATPLLASSSANSPGITFGGGQHLGALVNDYAQFLKDLLPDLGTPDSVGNSGLLYISRNDSGMRRILNEEELLPGLRKLGFNIVMPAKLPLSAQISLFRSARIIVSAHGAGLTNLLFSEPGTRLVEIFPEGGVHGSAFLRICSHRDFKYFFVVGEAVMNKQSVKNANNADIVLDIPATLSLIRDVMSG